MRHHASAYRSTTSTFNLNRRVEVDEDALVVEVFASTPMKGRKNQGGGAYVQAWIWVDDSLVTRHMREGAS